MLLPAHPYARCASWVGLLLAALCANLLLSSVTFAQGRKTAAQEPAGYRAAIGAAIEEFDLNHFTEAREHFARAHGLFPNARTLRGLGLSDFELRRYVAAVQYLEQALATDVKRLDGKLRSETDAILQRAKGYVGTLRLRAQPAETQVTLDGIPIERGSWDGLLVEVGDHLLEARATGYVTQRRELQLRGGQEESVELSLSVMQLEPSVEDTAPAPLTPAPTAPVTADKPVYKRWWLWTIVGVVVVGAAAGTAIALTRDKSTRYEPTTSANTPPGVALQPLWEVR